MSMFFFFFLLIRNVIDVALVLHGNVIFKKLCISKRLCFMLDFHIHKFDRQVKYMCVCVHMAVGHYVFV